MTTAVIWPAHHELVYWYKIKKFWFCRKMTLSKRLRFQWFLTYHSSNFSLMKSYLNGLKLKFFQCYHLYIMACNLIAFWNLRVYERSHSIQIQTVTASSQRRAAPELVVELTRVLCNESVMETSIGVTREVLS